MDMQAIAQIPNDTPSTFIYNALGWQYFEKNRPSSIADKVKAVAMTIFSILTLGAPVLFLKLAQIQYLEEEAEGEEWINNISQIKDQNARIDASVCHIEHFLEYQHIGLVIKTFDLLLVDLKDNSNKEATLNKCADLFCKYNQKGLFDRTSCLSSNPLFADLAELQVPKTNQPKRCEIL